MQLKTIWLLVCLCYPFREAHSSDSALPAIRSGPELLIEIELAVPADTWVKRPYLAIWIEDKYTGAIRTLALWYNKPRWLPELKPGTEATTNGMTSKKKFSSR